MGDEIFWGKHFVKYYIFTISSVSATDNQTEVAVDSMDLNETEVISDCDDNNQVASLNETEVISDSEDFHDFDEFNQIISQNTSEINLEHNYKCGNGSITLRKDSKFMLISQPATNLTTSQQKMIPSHWTIKTI